MEEESKRENYLVDWRKMRGKGREGWSESLDVKWIMSNEL